MTTQTLTIIGPPAIALFLSGWLRDNRLPRWLDTLIALIVILATALVWALFAGKLTGNLVIDMVIITGYAAALIAGPMAALHDWLTVNWTSPFAAFVEPDPIPAPVPVVSPSMVIAPAPSGLMPRSSLLRPGQTWTAIPVVTEAPTDTANAASGNAHSGGLSQPAPEVPEPTAGPATPA